MFDVDDGQSAAAIAILDSCLLPAAASSPVDACDATSLLWRLAATGMDVQDRWIRLSDAFARHWQPGFWPYLDMHAALAHRRADQPQRAAQLAHSVAVRAAAGDEPARRARLITLPFLRALDTALAGESQGDACAAGPLRALLEAAGGSRLQMQILASLPHERAPHARTAASRSTRAYAGGGDVDHYR